MKRLLFIADSHTGGAFGLFPPDFGNKPLNKIQTYLWECWQHMTAILPRLDAMILMGEQTEGSNVKEDSLMIHEVNRARQIDAAVEALKRGPLQRLKRGGAVHVLTGSHYHVGRQAEQAHSLGSQLLEGGYNVSTDAFGHRAHNWLHLSVEGVLFDIAHNQTATIVYRTMPLERELIHMLLRQGDDDVIVRAHTHTDATVSIGTRWAIALPPWKCQDGFATSSRTPNRWRTERIGSYLLEVSGAAKEGGGDPIRIVKYLYAAPQIERLYDAEATSTASD